jgi:hypothetical protein
MNLAQIAAWYGSVALGLAVLAGAIALARRSHGQRSAQVLARIESTLTGHWLPVALAIVTAAVVWWFWGSLQAYPVSHDERAYVLQAGIFSGGHWTARPPPQPRFFEQMHILVDQHVAAKYPPGHSLLLAPGLIVGLPGLVPVLLSALAGSLLFVVSRQLAGPWVAVLTWFLWVTESANVYWHSTYFSETTTAALWLMGWWSLLEWRRQPRWWLMAILGSCVGWGAITRPVTMLAFAIPTAIVVLWDVYRRSAYRDVIPGLTTTFVCLALIPLWSAKTTGNWRVTPVALYTREYMPWDRLGIGYDSTPPLKALPADLNAVAESFVTLHREYTAGAVVPALGARVGFLASDWCVGWRRVLLVFMVVGMFGLSAEIAVGLATAGLLIVAYLSYAHFAFWTLYYLEIVPLLAILTARGVWGLAVKGAGNRAGIAVVLAMIAAIPFAISNLQQEKASRGPPTNYLPPIASENGTIDTGKVLIFVRYSPQHDGHLSIVGNVPDPSAAKQWVAYDLGSENRELMDATPDRTPYLFDESTKTYSRLVVADPAARERAGP